MAYPSGTKSSGNIITSADWNDLQSAMLSNMRPTRVVDAGGEGTDTTIADAVTNLPSTGGMIFVKAGTYTFTSQLTITKPNVRIVGEGPESIITSTNLGSANQFHISFEGLNGSIENMKLELTANPTQSGTGGIDLKRDSCMVRNCIIDMGSRDGADFSNVGNAIHMDNTLSATDPTGFRVLNNVIIGGNNNVNISHTGNTGVISHFDISHNYMSHSRFDCVSLLSQTGSSTISNGTISNNTFENNDTQDDANSGDIRFRSGSGAIIRRVTCIGNAMEGNGSHPAYGIRVDSVTDNQDIVIVANVSRSHGTAEISDAGTSNTVANNDTA